MSSQHNNDVSVCVYMYAYVHIKAQAYIEIYIKFLTHKDTSLSFNRKFQEWTKATQKVKEETGQKSGTAET